MKRIWLIDDDTTYAFICRRLFQRAGHLPDYLTVLESGNQAIEHIRELQNQPKSLPELIFLDINMPYMNGWNFIQTFRKYRAHIEQPIHIIVLSSSNNHEDKRKASTYSEVSDYIVKPLTLSHIVTFMQ